VGIRIAKVSCLTKRFVVISVAAVCRETVESSIKIFNQYGDVQPPVGFTNIEVSPSSREFTLQNNRISASFNSLGLLKALKIGSNTIPVHLDFAKYGVRQAVERSGAYLFLPDGDAVPIQIENTIVNVIEGPIVSSVTVQLPYIRHIVTLYSSPGKIWNSKYRLISYSVILKNFRFLFYEQTKMA
jgi:alpha-mannosidase II